MGDFQNQIARGYISQPDFQTLQVHLFGFSYAAKNCLSRKKMLSGDPTSNLTTF